MRPWKWTVLVWSESNLFDIITENKPALHRFSVTCSFSEFKEIMTGLLLTVRKPQIRVHTPSGWQYNPEFWR